MTNPPKTTLGRRAFLLASSAGAVSAASSTSKKIRTAVHGIGHAHARGKVQTVREMSEYELVGICEPDEKQPRVHEVFQGVRWLSEREMLDDTSIEMIVVESDVRNNMNFLYAEKAVEAGKHVHLDKPPGESLAALKKLLEAADRRGVLVQMGYQWRYHPAMQKAIEAARKGWLGHIYMVRATINKPLDQEGRDYNAAYKGGMMFDLGSHMIDRIVDLLGKPKTIKSWVRHDSTVNDKLADNTLVVFEFEKAMAEVYIAAQQPHGNSYRTFQILGTEGTATVRPFFPELRMHVDLAYAAGPYKAGLQTIATPQPKQAPYEADFLALAGMIRNGDTPEYSMEHDLIVQEALLRACQMM